MESVLQSDTMTTLQVSKIFHSFANTNSYDLWLI
jgi:hypothetical protein